MEQAGTGDQNPDGPCCPLVDNLVAPRNPGLGERGPVLKAGDSRPASPCVPRGVGSDGANRAAFINQLIPEECEFLPSPLSASSSQKPCLPWLQVQCCSSGASRLALWFPQNQGPMFTALLSRIGERQGNGVMRTCVDPRSSAWRYPKSTTCKDTPPSPLPARCPGVVCPPLSRPITTSTVVHHQRLEVQLLKSTGAQR